MPVFPALPFFGTWPTTSGSNELPPLFDSDLSIGSSYIPSDEPSTRTPTHLYRPNTDITHDAAPPPPSLGTTMPPSTRKRTAAAVTAATSSGGASGEPPSAKRRRTQRPATKAEPQAERHNPEEDIIDLVDKEEWDEPPEAPSKENWTKLSAFQCAICMDYVTGLVALHCGHLFCGDCLENSLLSEAVYNRCPMCRAPVEMKSRSMYTARTKGYWPLELKLMTAPRKGTAPGHSQGQQR